jgi:hypothetical protein
MKNIWIMYVCHIYIYILNIPSTDRILHKNRIYWGYMVQGPRYTHIGSWWVFWSTFRYILDIFTNASWILRIYYRKAIYTHNHLCFGHLWHKYQIALTLAILTIFEYILYIQYEYNTLIYPKYHFIIFTAWMVQDVTLLVRINKYSRNRDIEHNYNNILHLIYYHKIFKSE